MGGGGGGCCRGGWGGGERADWVVGGGREGEDRLFIGEGMRVQIAHSEGISVGCGKFLGVCRSCAVCLLDTLDVSWSR